MNSCNDHFSRSVTVGVGGWKRADGAHGYGDGEAVLR